MTPWELSGRKGKRYGENCLVVLGGRSELFLTNVRAFGYWLGREGHRMARAATNRPSRGAAV